ncbi:MAG: amino acid permease [Oscillospiraceae bacterium]|nr:amino acid permease [Oscillospiraceae bacterium]
MENRLEKRYGLLTAICMVVGIVIGSGVFFKAQSVLGHTNGNVPLGIIAWLIGGAVMILCALNFANLGTRYEKVNGLVDYAEATMGSRYAYLTGWFATVLYYPAMTSVLAWVSARYTLELFGSSEITGGLCMSLACFYLCLSFAVNALAPKIAGKFQVSTTFLKLIPLVLMAVVGLIVGLASGNTVQEFTAPVVSGENGLNAGGMIFVATVATAFAYEGWIIATTINSELKNAKRNLPIALIIGCSVIVVVYIVYYIGLAGAAPVEELMKNGANVAFLSVFGKVGGTFLYVFVVVSCLGTLNGLMLANQRGMYSLGMRNEGPKPAVMAEVSGTVNMPVNSAVVALVVNGFWMFYFYGANLNSTPLFGVFSFDSSELPIITIYALYIPMFIKVIHMHGREGFFKNVLLPILGIAASVFMVFAAVYAHGIVPYQAAAAQGRFACPVVFYLIVFVAVMIVGNCFYKKKTG